MEIIITPEIYKKVYATIFKYSNFLAEEEEKERQYLLAALEEKEKRDEKNGKNGS